MHRIANAGFVIDDQQRMHGRWLHSTLPAADHFRFEHRDPLPQPLNLFLEPSHLLVPFHEAVVLHGGLAHR